MKKTSLICCVVVLGLFIAGCNDNSTTPSDNSNQIPASATSYFPLTKGSSWTYTGTKNYTVTITGDTIVNGRSYILARTDMGDVSLTRYSSGKYYSYGSALLSSSGETMMLDEAPGSTWQFDINVSGANNHYVYTNAEQGLSRTVRGNSYSNVDRVHMTLTTTVIGFPGEIKTENDYFYAKGVGLIEAQFQGVGGEQLESYTIK